MTATTIRKKMIHFTAKTPAGNVVYTNLSTNPRLHTAGWQIGGGFAWVACSQEGWMLRLRLATSDDVPAVRDLIEASVRGLSAGYYTDPQVESALRHVFGPDTQLIADRTYFVIEADSGALVAAGGWSRRRTLYGGDQMKGADDPLLDPSTEAARIRAFFVHPAWARRGLGRRLFDRCAADAVHAGFRTAELMATLPGEPLYMALGFEALERSATVLPDGEILPVVRMVRPLPPAQPR
jgi:GNAT superfamily N-acetyltransferase